MPDASALHEALHSISEQIDEGMSERDVENLFLEQGFYGALDYVGTGTDIRSEFTLPDDRRPDYLTLDGNERVTAVYEFKTSGRDLSPHTDQLLGYMEDLRAEYGVLTNGERLELYHRGRSGPILEVSLAAATESDARDLTSPLAKPEWDITDPASVTEYVDALDPVPLEGDLGQAHFFDTFRLQEGSPFAELVTAMMDLLRELRDEQDAKFVTGAYDFWEASYASEPEDVPNSWDSFVDGSDDLQDFMFCLESGHALLARLLLAKACEDRDFFPPNTGLREYFREIQGFGGHIDLDAYPLAATGLLEDMRTHLVESLFEDDIFIWWTDGYKEERDRGHSTPQSLFRDVAREGSDIERVGQATRERFSRAVAHVFFAALKFDLSAISGDPLGDLYQHYFDPETRKALGEFYTPQEVVEYIMDGVEYDVGVSNRRLMDPACGSGTFVVEAVDRYLDDVRRYEDDPDWQEHLTDLCSRPAIVGLDIHPFAVLMAQIRFMIAILPEYREAKQANRDFTIRRLPIFRTDTLRKERESTGIDLGEDGERQMTFDAMTENNQDVLIPVPLPVEVEEDEASETEGDFLVQRIRMPLFDTIQFETGVSNFGEYFAALQGVLDVVKWYIERGRDGEDLEYGGGLREGIGRYTTREYDGIEEFFAPYVDDILDTVQYLRDEHGDGRLFKMFEDTVLALVVKNYMEYDYVVGNPPYVRIQNLPDSQKRMLDQLYESTTGNYDIYGPFYERGLDWLNEDTGKLGFITPNQFMVTDYGEGLRRVLLRESRIKEVYDFRDSGVFEDAKNYPAIVILEDEQDRIEREENEIRCVRVKGDTKAPSDRSLDTAILDAVRDHRKDPGYEDEFINVFDYPQSDLDDGYWSLMPPEELSIIHKMEAASDATVGDVTDSVFAGTQTSANDVFLVTPVDADRIPADNTGDTVTVVPKGESREYEIETDTLRPWLQGRDINRWRGDWSGEHAIVPYTIEKDDNGDLTSNLIDQERLEDELPLTWSYLTEHQNTLESREDGRFEDRADWYGFGYPKSMTRFEEPKLICPEIAAEATFMLDDVGTWYFKAAYGVQLEDQFKDRTDTFAALLNSDALDFYIKHYTALKVDGFYKYTTNYLTPLPITWGDDDDRQEIRDHVSSITAVLDTESKTARFPEAYLGEYDGELDYITYEWQTRRYPVNAEVDGDEEGEFTVQAGRSDRINDPAMYSDDRKARKMRAEYVRAAVDGRNVKSGSETTIPIPRNDRGVEALIEDLHKDEETVGQTNLDELEGMVNNVVYDMFEITHADQDVIEKYLEEFRVY